MGKIFHGDKNTEKDIDLIKNDIKELTEKLRNLKDNSRALLSDQLEHFNEVVNELKQKGAHEMQNNLADLYSSTRQNPIRNLCYAFVAGVLITAFLGKR